MEDIMFGKILEEMGIIRTKDMYRRATRPHQCMMCCDKPNEAGYVLKEEYVYGYDTPFWSICSDCYEELD